MASTPRFANQVAISFRSRVIVEKYLLCFRNSPSSSITNTQAVTLFLCTSMPQQRLYTIRITGSFSEPGCEDARNNLESPPRARKIRQQFVVPCSVQVKLPRGLSRASLVTTFSPHQAQNRA
jgi:hypothetical protein